MASLSQTTPGVTDLDASGDPEVEGAFYDPLTNTDAARVSRWASLGGDKLEDSWGAADATPKTGTAAYSATPANVEGRAFSNSSNTGYAATVPFPSTGMTTCCWLNLASLEMPTGVQAGVFSWFNAGGEFLSNELRVGSPAYLRFVSFDIDDDNAFNVWGESRPQELLPAGEWFHTAVTLSTSDLGALYVDGVEVGSSTKAVNQAAIDPDFEFLARRGSLASGSLVADLRVYSRTLSGAELAALYNGPEPTVTAAPCTFTGGQLTGTPTVDNPTGETVLPYTINQRWNGSAWVTVAEGANYDAYTPTESGTFRRVYVPRYASNRVADPVPSSSVTIASKLTLSDGLPVLDGSGLPTYTGAFYDPLTTDASLERRYNGDGNDDGTPDAIDATGSTNDGTWTGSYATGQFGGSAFVGDGATEMSVPDITLDGAYTIAFRIKADEQQTNVNGGVFRGKDIVGDGDVPAAEGYGLWVNRGTGRLWGFHGNVSVSDQNSGPNVEGEGWVAAALSYDAVGGIVKLRSGGVTYATNTEQASPNIYFNKLLTQKAERLLGELEDFRHYSRALSDAEVDAIGAGPQSVATNVTLSATGTTLTAAYDASDPSNGTVTKRYLFQRDDSGTWVNVQFGTSATYAGQRGKTYRVIAIPSNNAGDGKGVASSSVGLLFYPLVARPTAVSVVRSTARPVWAY